MVEERHLPAGKGWKVCTIPAYNPTGIGFWVGMPPKNRFMAMQQVTMIFVACAELKPIAELGAEGIWISRLFPLWFPAHWRDGFHAVQARRFADF